VAPRACDALAAEIDKGVTELIELVGAVDGILQAQAAADTHYFVEVCGRPLSAAEVGRCAAVFSTLIAGSTSFRRQGSALHRGAWQPDHARAGRAHREGARAAPRMSAQRGQGVHASLVLGALQRRD
jgi:hypothetical protein